jgi:hypothetical protein
MIILFIGNGIIACTFAYTMQYFEHKNGDGVGWWDLRDELALVLFGGVALISVGLVYS